jgi:hypothetical protein
VVATVVVKSRKRDDGKGGTNKLEIRPDTTQNPAFGQTRLPKDRAASKPASKFGTTVLRPASSQERYEAPQQEYAAVDYSEVGNDDSVSINYAAVPYATAPGQSSNSSMYLVPGQGIGGGAPPSDIEYAAVPPAGGSRHNGGKGLPNPTLRRNSEYVNPEDSREDLGGMYETPVALSANTTLRRNPECAESGDERYVAPQDLDGHGSTMRVEATTTF